MRLSNVIIVSRFGIFISIIFVIFALLYRILLPFGDEPDFEYRATMIVNESHALWSPYYILKVLAGDLTIESNCLPKAGVLSFWASIPSNCATELDQIFIRWLLTLYTVLPLLFFLIFSRIPLSASVVNLKQRSLDWEKRLHALGVSLIFPSMVYYLGVLAEEQFVLILSLFVFLCYDRPFCLAILLAFIITIDLGNAIVILFFVGLLYGNNFILRYFGRVNFLVLNIILVIATYMIGHYLLNYFVIFMPENVGNKVVAMQSLLEEGDFIDKYPVILRPIITFMSYIFMTPSGIKVIFVYVIGGVVMLFLFHKVMCMKNTNSKKLLNFYFTPLVTVLFFVLLFPNYSHAKYYIFMLPFIMFVASSFYSKKRVMFFSFGASVVVIIHLALYAL